MDIRRTDTEERTKRRRAIAFGGVLAAALLAVLVVTQFDLTIPTVPRSSVWVDTVRRGEMLREVRAPGVLVPREIRWVAAQTGARVERILVRPGAVVGKDTVIMELSEPELLDRHLAASAEFAAAEADLVAHQMSLESQLLDYRTALGSLQAEHEAMKMQAEAEMGLVESGIMARIPARRSELAVEQLARQIAAEKKRIANFRNSIVAQLAADRARLSQLSNTLELRLRQVESLQVTAGIDGVLQQVPVQEGQQVQPGTNLARVARPGELNAELRVPETQVSDVRLNQVARIDTRSGEAEGRVLRIDPAVTDGAVLVEIGFNTPLPDGARPDLSVDGIIEIERLPDVTYTGRPAVGQAGSELSLFRIDDSGLARRVSIRVGRISSSFMEIEQGLEEGDQVILSDTSPWADHEILRVD